MYRHNLPTSDMPEPLLVCRQLLQRSLDKGDIGCAIALASTALKLVKTAREIAITKHDLILAPYVLGFVKEMVHLTAENARSQGIEEIESTIDRATKELTEITTGDYNIEQNIKNL